MIDINKYYQSLIQEVATRQMANEEGDTQEQTFTRLVLDILSDTGDSENAAIAYDEKALGTKNQHKINGYAIADNYETVDLFISIYTLESDLHSTPKEEIDRAATRITNFFRKAIYGDYAKEVAESSEIFEFANTLDSYKELRDNLVRVNAFILTNGEYKGAIPEPKTIHGYSFFYRVIDIRYLYQVAVQSRVPIEIDFEEEKYEVKCLSADSSNPDYQAYVAIIPGMVLANLYERYGDRLLEMNVRSFLQFTGKINKGIRDTIKNEPHMFLAFNNGLAATADNIEIDSSTSTIKKISNLQIVNGGQTTASIYHTYKKDKADISNVFVQAKFSVVKRKEEYASIVSRISRYANTQNKVKDADFTVNNVYLVAFEKLSRFFMTPLTEDSNVQTYWFYERARGQYKNLSIKEGFTKSRKAAFELKYPKKQVITKVQLAKYINAYKEVYDGKKLAIGPHIVVRGDEKNFSRYINDNLPSKLKEMTNVYYEDAIAKTILFRTVDTLYGTKRSQNSIGELKQVIVPYSISLLNVLTNDKLNLYKIWKNQKLSPELCSFMHSLMVKLNAFIIEQSPSSHYIEWSKKEDCWNLVKSADWSCDISQISADLITGEESPRKIVTLEKEDEASLEHEKEIIQSIPYPLWEKIAEWGKDSGYLTLNYQTSAKNIAEKLRTRQQLKDYECTKAIEIFDIVCEQNSELLMEADDLTEDIKKKEAALKKEKDNSEITIELVRRMVEFDRRKRILEAWKWKVMDDIANGRKTLNERFKWAIAKNLEVLRKHGFEG